MKIVRKNFLIVASMIIMSLGLMLGLLYFALPVYYNQVKKQNLRSAYLRVVDDLDGRPKATILKQIDDHDRRNPHMLLSLYNADSDIVYPKSDTESRKKQVEDYLTKGNFDEIGSWTNLINSEEGEHYYLLAEYGFYSLSDISQTLVTFYPFVLLLIFILAVTVAFVYSRLSTRRLTTISERTRQMQSLEAGITCPVLGKDEVATLAQNINNLYGKLLTSIEDLRIENERSHVREKEKSDFLRITSHELKTPIASMIGLVEGMLYNVGPFKDHETYLRQCREILREQADLVQAILEATNIDMAFKESGEVIQMDQLIAGALTSYYGLAEVHELTFEVSLAPTLVKGNADILLKAIKNILDNAFRYSRDKGKVRLLLADHRLVVDNQVDHLLTQEDLEQIFRPFYRPDFSRDRKDGGTGIGLFMVQQVLDKHDFEYSFQATDHETMRFLIRFPIEGERQGD